MNGRFRFEGTRQHLLDYWPTYALLYGGMVASFLLIGISIQRGWFSYIPLSLALILILGYFLATSLWAAHQLTDPGKLEPYNLLFNMAQLRRGEQFVYLDLGQRREAMKLVQRLTTGRMILIDLYNPQWTTSRALARRRKRMLPMIEDPRICWREGQFDLLPLPDQSVSTVIMHNVAGEFWLRGDRLQLLREVRRILETDGRLLMAERVRTRANWLFLGPGALNLQTAAEWEALLQEAGLEVKSSHSLQGLIHCFRADRPNPNAAQQLALDFASNNLR